MEWDINNGSYLYHGLALGTKPQIAHLVRLYKSGHEFDIEIISIDGSLFKGKIISVGRLPSLGAINFKRGEIVSFHADNIQCLSHS